eukprot:5500671-Amphidinium_carterae.1
MRAHARLQHVPLEDKVLVQWIKRLLSLVCTHGASGSANLTRRALVHVASAPLGARCLARTMETFRPPWRRRYRTLLASQGCARLSQKRPLDATHNFG